MGVEGNVGKQYTGKANDSIEEDTGRKYTGQVVLFGRKIIVEAQDTGKGMNVLVYGGDAGHIGAVCVGCQGRVIQTIRFPGHKEGIVCEKWVQAIMDWYPYPVVVSAGIHYDKADADRIARILGVLDEMLEKLHMAWV